MKRGGLLHNEGLERLPEQFCNGAHVSSLMRCAPYEFRCEAVDTPLVLYFSYFIVGIGVATVVHRTAWVWTATTRINDRLEHRLLGD